MRTILSFLVIFFLSIVQTKFLMAQEVEATLLGRYDKHADYTTRFGSRSYTTPTQLAGLSYGLAVGYKFILTRHLFARVAAGYYQLRIDEVRQSTPWGTATERNFEDSHDPSAMLHRTGKYHYNTLPLSVGMQAKIPLSKSVSFTTGAEILYYPTFSQRYQRTYRKDYKTFSVRTLGWGCNAQVGWCKQWNTVFLSPQIVLPLYQVIKGDPVFLEDENMRIPKWFNGGGLMISVGKYL